MLPTNVMSFMKKMVSNTETVSTSSTQQFMTTSVPTSSGAIGRLRQTLQQAHESVSTRLQQNRTVLIEEQIPSPDTQSVQSLSVNQVSTPVEEKENQEAARPGSAGRCRVCVKAMKPDEYSKECTECGLQVCDDCASYSHNADGNEVAWRCSVCRRRGQAIIARGVQRGIEQSEVLEGLGCETMIRKSPDNRRLTAGSRADSETEVLLLAPKPSDVRRHSDVPLRDILKFQQSNISNATSSNNLAGAGLTLGVGLPAEKAKSSSELGKKEPSVRRVSVSVAVKDVKGGGGGPPPQGKAPNPKTANMKRQRSYERGASEGALNLPQNARGRRASCDMRATDASQSNNNNVSVSSENTKDTGQITEKDLIRLQQKHQQAMQQQQHPQKHSQHPQQHQQHAQQGQQHQQQHAQHQQHPQQQHPQQHAEMKGRDGRKTPSDLNISPADAARRRSVQILHSSAKQAPQPRSCASLDQEAQAQQQQQRPGHRAQEVKRQGSSQDGESIKIVIDDVDSTARAIDNNKAPQNEDFRTRVVRLRRDPQDRGYQTRGFGVRVVGGCNVQGKPGNLRARVARVTPGSGADFAGIRRGDIVLTWNGIKLTNLTFEEVCKVLDTSGDTIEITIAAPDNDQIPIATVPENEATVGGEWGEQDFNQGDQYNNPPSPTSRGRQLPRLPTEGRIQLRLFHDEVHNTLEIAVVNIAFGNEDCTTIDLNDIIITLRIGEKVANTRWNQCVLFTKVSPEDLFDSWLVLELNRGPDFLGESHIDMGRVSLDDRPVWFPFSAKGSSSHRGSISQIINAGGNTPPGARDLARRLRMRMAAGSQSQSEEQDDSSGQSSPCASSLLRPEVAWEVLGTLGPPSANLTSRSAPTSRRGSAQSDRVAIGLEVDDGRGSAPSTPLALPRSLPPSRRGSFAVAVEQVINQTRRGSVVYQQQPPRGVADLFGGRQLPEIPDGMDSAILRSRRQSAYNPREVGFDRRSQFERNDSLRAIQAQPRRTSEVVQSFRDVVFEARRARKAQEEEAWRQQSPSHHWGDRG